jgi:hypothetical protein
MEVGSFKSLESDESFSLNVTAQGAIISSKSMWVGHNLLNLFLQRLSLFLSRTEEYIFISIKTWKVERVCNSALFLSIFVFVYVEALISFNLLFFFFFSPLLFHYIHNLFSWGALYALEAFSQLLYYNSTADHFFIIGGPVFIADQPRFPWRGSSDKKSLLNRFCNLRMDCTI